MKRHKYRSNLTMYNFNEVWKTLTELHHQVVIPNQKPHMSMDEHYALYNRDAIVDIPIRPYPAN